MLQRANHRRTIRTAITGRWVNTRELYEDTGLTAKEIKAVIAMLADPDPIFARRWADDRRVWEYRIYPRAVQVRTT